MKDGDFLFKKIIAALLSLTLAASVMCTFAGCGNTKSDSDKTAALSTSYKTADSIKNGCILQCFCWNFNTIKASMADIAAAGYTAVQTSPINECLKGDDGGMELYGNGKWYYHYQPTDFKIGNYQVGSRDEFKAMCKEADKYGIKVIVDVIANHTTPQTDAVSKDLINAGGGSLATLYHENNDKDISDYGDRLQCTTYKMGGLPDINTERPSFQNYFIKYINDCIACGADGFRYDTAKHIGLPDDEKEDDGFKNNFWSSITKDVDNADKIFNYGEVLQGSNDRIADYVKAIGRTTASTYGSKIRSGIINGNVDTSVVSDYWLGNAPLNMVTWVESHDNYINDGTWSTMTKDQVILGWAIITARKDGTPLFFDRPYDSSSENEWGMNRIGTQGDDMYKDKRVSAVNYFRTAMQGETETLVNPDSESTALAIERGKKGLVIVNTTDKLKVNFKTSLEDGTYVDRVDGKTEYVVKSGTITCKTEMPENSVAVLYNKGYTQYAQNANVGVGDDTDFVYDTSSMTVTLTCSNTNNAVYSLDGGKETSYKNGDNITIKPSSKNEVTTLVLKASNSQKIQTEERVEFTHKKSYKITKGTKVYFEKPSGDTWDDDIYAYVYDVNQNENESWPGIQMKKESNGKYSYTFDRDWSTPYIIFDDGGAADGVQYPTGQGLDVVPDKVYTAE